MASLKSHSKIRVLIADDSALMRREIRKIIEEDPAIEVVAVVRNGQEAVDKVRELKPDVVTLDINMPVMDGLTALQFIMMENPLPVIMLSSLTQEGASTSYEAMELGAVDFLGKPGGTVSLDLDKVGRELIEKIKNARGAKLDRIVAGRRRRTQTRENTPKSRSPVRSIAEEGNDLIVVIGQSTGGPNAIMEVIPHIPADFPAALLIVQHMPGNFTPSFAQRIARNIQIPFKEALSGDVLQAGQGYLAPGDIHLVLTATPSQPRKRLVRLSKMPNNTLHTPSVDVTMMSVLEHYGRGTLGVLLTGMGADGADAMVEIRKSGSTTIAESEETAVVFGMPKEAIRRGGAAHVLPLHQIGEKIVEWAYSQTKSMRNGR